jgi:hypothetical protein
MSIGTFMSIGTLMSIVRSIGRLLIAPATAAATGLPTGAVTAQERAAIAQEAAADTEVAAGIGAEAAAAIADHPDRDRSRPDRCAASGRPIRTAALS